MGEKTERDFHVVGIGTSAGGLEALESFFSNMPLSNKLAFVVVQHLSPDYKSHMVQLLSKCTPMPVYEAKDGVMVTPSNIYLLPRRKNMTIFKGKLYLTDYNRGHGLNLPIDIFFRSLANDQGEKAIGVILSGTGSDGTRGIRTIKEMGGMVMAQDDTAKFDGMPSSAIATRLVDYIAPAEKMPTKLLQYVNHPRSTTDSEAPLQIVDDKDAINKLFAVLQEYSHVDFSGYKSSTVARRIKRRMSINQIEQLKDYVVYLQENSAECRVLYKELLIGVTRFFRDPEAFTFLQKEILPALFEEKLQKKLPIRIWIPGCSTGEEAYSLAIIFQEYREAIGQYVEIKIFATDLDKDALEYASAGTYPESTMADVPPNWLYNYFLKKGNTYEILHRIRSMVVFAHQNLLKDPPFSKIDLVSCRNLLIYFQTALQKKVLETFQFSLNRGGYLFLGNSETIGDFDGNFQVKHAKWRVYQYERGGPPIPSSIETMEKMEKMKETEEANKARANDENQRQDEMHAYRRAKYSAEDWRSSDPILRSVVEQVLPPCVVVDENYTLVHAFGDVRQYLQAPIGYRVNLNVLSMAREELALPLSTGLHRAVQDKEEVIYRNIHLVDKEQSHQINLTIRPFWERNSRQRLFLIALDPVDADGKLPEHAETFNLSHSVSQRISDLEQELQYSKENQQAMIEELETANEELQATNQELMAANEELQSTNEELQSVNEELITVNSEYQVKIKELTAINDDMDNLLRSSEIGTIFLDADLCLRKFTPATQASVNVLEQDLGRPFSHITHNLKDIDLVKLAQHAMEKDHNFQEEVQSKAGRWYLLKAMPYHTHRFQIEGVVITLIDVTALKHTQLMVENHERIRQYLQFIGIMVVALNPQGEITFINKKGCELLGYREVDLIGKNWFQTCLSESKRDETVKVFRALLTGEVETVEHFQNTVITRDGQPRLIAWDNTTLLDDDGEIIGTLSSGVDISDAENTEKLGDSP